MGPRIFSLPRQVLSLPSRKTPLPIPRAREARVAREARAAREVKARLADAVIRDGTAGMLPSMGHAMACAYDTVFVDAIKTNAVKILIAQHPTLLLDRAMGSWSRSGPRGYRACQLTATRASSVSTNTGTAKSRSRLNMASRSRVISLR